MGEPSWATFDAPQWVDSINKQPAIQGSTEGIQGRKRVNKGKERGKKNIMKGNERNDELQNMK